MTTVPERERTGAREGFAALTGLHHVTAITGTARENVRFYTHTLPRLSLPLFLEGRRADIEAGLEPL